MEISRDQPQPSVGERSARWAVLVFLMLAIVTLAFGLGYLVKDLDGGTAQSTALGAANGTSAKGDLVGGAILDEIVEILQAQYVDKTTLDAQALRKAAIGGLITSLNDVHTEYLTPADIKAGALNLDSSYDGIGATVTDTSGPVQIVAPFRDSPAELAGIRAGDTIIKVDGERIDGWTKEQAVERIRGAKGTKVVLEVKHTDGKVETLTITRGEIPLESVFSEPNLDLIPGESGKKFVDRTGAVVTDIAYLNISQFHDRTVSELKTKLKDVEGKYKGLVLDLRGNPGGLLGATVEVADEFLNSGVVLSELDANGKTRSWSAKSGGLATKIPIVILMDKGSASGSEVLAGALRDNGRATIVGTRSFGKGTVNQLQPLKKCGDPAGCGALYLAVGRWLSPNGEQIEGVGIKPDLELPMTRDEYIDRGDIQVFKAIDILHGK